MTEPRWLSKDLVLAIHNRQLAEHGGAAGVRDEGLLESALARPQNLHAYGEGDVVAMAAAYAFGIARNHPFIDGNKRTAFVACELFLAANGFELVASDEECLAMMLSLAASEIDEAEFAMWLRDNVQPR
ncbi:MAG: type II toxin-antitoxin system death-on-curing family toxin [Proteobacteria bacterium]|nr:type II toxin-antitoxin system death-on-curing family toxin [Pseudomonadota bacterium]